MNAYKLNKERESERRKLKTLLQRTEQEISACEERITQANAELQDPAVSADYEKVLALTEEISQLDRRVEELMETWEESTQRLNEIEEALS